MSFDTIIFLIIFAVLSGVSSWVQKRRQAQAEREAQGNLEPPQAPRPSEVPRRQPGPVATPAPSPALPQSWEVVLRRLLEGQTTSPPPPLVVPGNAPKAPGRSPTPAAPRTAQRHRPAPVPVAELEEGAEASPALARLDQSAQAYDRAKALHESVAEQLRRVDSRTEHPIPGGPPVPRQGGRAEIASARRLIQHPGSARQAIIATTLLGPPRALDPI